MSDPAPKLCWRHVLCVYPFREELGPRGRFYPPLGLEIIAAVIGRYARCVDVIDLRHETGTTAQFIRPATDLVCFSINWDCERETVRDEINSVPHGVLTVLGGRAATNDPEWWLRECPGVDILVRGDGEEAVREIGEGVPLEAIDGISWRSGGRVVHNDVRSPGPVTDDFRPDRRLRRYEYVLDAPELQTGLTFDTIVSSLGCPHNCAFCALDRSPWGVKRGWSGRSPESVVDELESMSARVVAFVDLNFTHDLDRVGRICDLLIDKRVHKKYFAETRVEIARSPETVRKMAAAGFAALALGVESATDRTLKSMRKGFDTARLREYFKVLRRSGILLHGHFIIGAIGEDEAEMLAIARFAKELGLDTITANLLTYYPYTGLDELLEANPEYHVAPDKRIYSDAYSPERLRGIRDEILHTFYSTRQVARVVRKLMKQRLLTLRVLRCLPRLLVSAVRGRFNPERGRDPESYSGEGREVQTAPGRAAG